MRTTNDPTNRRTHAARSIVALAALGLVTTGCGRIVENATEKVVEEGVERAIEADTGGDVEVDLDGDGTFTVEGEDGDVTFSVDENGVQIDGTDADGNDFSLDADEGGVDIETGDTSGSLDVDDDGSFTVTDEDGEVITGEADDDGSFTIEGEDGSSVFDAGPGIPDQWPDDVPVPEGLSDVNGTYFAENDLENATVIGTSSDSVEDVFDSYTAALEDAGFEEESRFTQAGDAASAVYVQGDRRVTISVNAGSNGTDVAVSVG